eukprot:3657003-Rhodomonas_salina.1
MIPLSSCVCEARCTPIASSICSNACTAVSGHLSKQMSPLLKFHGEGIDVASVIACRKYS